MHPNRMKRKLLDKQPVIGVNVQLDSPWLIELIGQAGFDFVMLDEEHGIVAPNLPNLIIAADAVGITPIVRVPTHERGFLITPLEAGAGGLQVAMVNTAEQARALVRETKYAPLGQRGISNVTRAANYGAYTIDEWVKIANQETLLIVQIETVEGLRNASEIARVPGVDMIFIGPGDLAQSMNLLGKTDRTEMINAMKQVICQVRDIVPVGTTAFSTEEAQMWRSEGVLSILTSSMLPIRRTFDNLYQQLKDGIERAKEPANGKSLPD